MAVTYSRDAIAATMVKVYRMLETIRQGIFDPDASRAARIAMATGVVRLASHLPEQNECLRRSWNNASGKIENFLQKRSLMLKMRGLKSGH